MRTRPALAALGAALVALRSPSPAPFGVIALPAAVRGVMSDLWRTNNRHWDELADQNILTQLLGTGKPTQREYLGCLVGEVVRDTLFVRQVVPAAGLRQMQFAVTGSCDGVADLVGSFHTHPFRADAEGHAVKERGLSTTDLHTFAASSDLVAMVMWDADSLDVAAKPSGGALRHPAPLAVR
jgi:hypothetical protein